jgi:cytochrome d ubiquinol oxidase subunit I
MYIIGWVNNKEEKTTGIKIPGGLSFLTHGNFSTPVQGLHATPPQDRPRAVNFIFQTYHIMISIGMTLIGLTLLALILLWRKKLFQQRWLMIIFAWAVLLPQIANQVGWYAAEVGRQPWVVYKLLRTSDALSRKVTADQVMFSLILFTLVYVLLFVLFLYLLNRKIQHGPDVAGDDDHDQYYPNNLANLPS